MFGGCVWSVLAASNQIKYDLIIQGSLEVKLPTKEERRSEKRKSQKKEDADARKGRKVAKHCVFPMICGVEK